MSATSQRQAILQDVEASLRAIIAGNPVAPPGLPPGAFKTTVALATRIPRTWSPTTVAPSDTPFIGILSGTDRITYLPGNEMWRDWDMHLICLVDGATGEDKLQAIDSLEDDITAALSADTTRSGNAVRTNIVAVDRDDLAEANQVAMTIQVQVRYYRSVGET